MNVQRIVYRIRYAVRLWSKLRGRYVPGMTLIEAFRYPCDPLTDNNDPIEDADIEMSYMAQDCDA